VSLLTSRLVIQIYIQSILVSNFNSEVAHQNLGFGVQTQVTLIGSFLCWQMESVQIAKRLVYNVLCLLICSD
jgi:hypothetical protein